MIEIIKLIITTAIELLGTWFNASADEQADLEKRATDSLSVMRGERKIAHEEISARDDETRKIIAEEKAKLPPKPES